MASNNLAVSPNDSPVFNDDVIDSNINCKYFQTVARVCSVTFSSIIRLAKSSPGRNVVLISLSDHISLF